MTPVSLDSDSSFAESPKVDRRRRQVLVAITLGLLGPAARSAIIKPHRWVVSAVDQGSANLCWLASSAMMMSAAVKRSVGMREVAEFLGDPYLRLYHEGTTKSGGGALYLDDVPELAKRLGLEANGFASFDLAWWVEKLRLGPVMVFGVNKEASTMGHMKVLSDLSGDASSTETLTATVVDPNGGEEMNQPFVDFIEFYERASSAATVQIFSFGPYGTSFPSHF